ncbi:MAG: dihydrolipoyl dehydrogenase [Betaproteobacteria bacterium]|nr:dihydrolipoyl dehydrogenase [Betaproteobacteria bacterium]
MANQFDVVVIGAGPGGYVAAIRAAQLGFSVACIDAWVRNGKPSLGGTCVNVGCIPSKALLQSSENYHAAGHELAKHGIGIQGLTIDVAAMQKRKDGIVDQLTAGVQYLFKKNKVTQFHGQGRFSARIEGGWQIKVACHDGGAEEVMATNVIVATGSVPRQLPGATIDNKLVCDNEGALAMAAVPARLGVVGAGVIGLELGSVWKRLGSAVTVLEALPEFLGAADEQIAKEARKIFTRDTGLDIQTGVNITKVAAGKKGVAVDYTDAAGKAQSATFDRLIVAIGRVPTTAGLNAEGVGLALDARGFVAVDGDCRTNLPGVWAVGDVVRGPMLAHKAEEEGAAVAERIAGQHGHVDFNTVPWVIYTSPEIAWVGKTEQALKAEGVAYRAGSFPFSANGRAKALGDQRGLVKFLADAATDRILGVHMIGPLVSELIAEAAVAMEFGASAEDIARICHAHPSLSEVVHEAAMAVEKRSIHI